MGRPTTISNEQILAAARQVFLRQGSGAATADIAREAGISEGSIFKRFATKEDLFVAAMGPPEGDYWGDRLPGLVGKGDVRVNLTEIAFSMVEFFRVMIPRVHMMWSSGSGQASHAMAGKRATQSIKEVSVFFEEEMRLGRWRRCDPEVVARLFIGSLYQFVAFETMGWNVMMPIPMRTFVRGLVDFMWEGGAPETQEQPPRR